MDQTRGATIARWTYRIAAVYGTVVLSPLYFAAPSMAAAGHPVTQPEFFFGFIGAALCFQILYWLIGGDPERYRALMPLSCVAKLSFAMPCAILFAAGRLEPLTFGLSQVDTVLAIGFAYAWVATRPA